MAIGYPGGQSNTYIPTLDLSGNLMVSFSRNTASFPLNKYITITPVKLPFGSYLRFNPLDLARLRNKPYGSQWAPGTLRPTGFHNTVGFEQRDFRCTRYNHSITLDKLAVDVANWPVQKTHTEMLGQEAMTERAYQVCRKLTDSSQYAASHTVTASSLAGGFLDGGTTADPRIFKALSGASQIIQADSMGRVKQGDLGVLMNHNTAIKLARSRELREYVMQQQDAWKQITLDDTNYNNRYGLPKTLYTYEAVVEDTYYNDSNRGATGEAGSVVFPDNTMLVFVRKGGLEASEGAANYSTCSLFVYEDMTVEANEDVRNRLLYMDVVDHFAVEVVAPVTAVLITNVFS